MGASGFSMDLSRGRLPKTRERRAPRIRARAEECIMTIKRQDSELRHPEAVAFLQGLTDEQAAKQPPLSLEHDGVVTRYWRDSGRVHCDEFPASEAGALDVLMRVVESELGRSLPLLAAQLQSGSDLRRCRQFRQLRGSEPQAQESGRRGGDEGDPPAPRHADRPRDPDRSSGRMSRRRHRRSRFCWGSTAPEFRWPPARSRAWPASRRTVGTRRPGSFGSVNAKAEFPTFRCFW